MSRIGILGGTFNPIHNGHIMLAQYCKNEVQLDKIILVPTCTPPHKSNKHLADESHRLKMCSLASNSLEGFEVSDVEIRRKGKSYTYETLSYFKEIYPDDELYFIMGADMFLSLHIWKNPEVIFSHSNIIAIPRDESNIADLQSYYSSVIQPMGAKAVILPNSVKQVSSTQIRDNINNKNIIKSLIDENVLDYIEKNNLYRM